MRKADALLAIGWAIWIATTPFAQADEGHNHSETPAASSGLSLPRFAAVSETFELLGILNGGHLTLYLDRFADGSPVKDAGITLQLGGEKVPLAPHGEGKFEGTLAQEPKEGTLPFLAMVTVGNKAVRLAGEFMIRYEVPIVQAKHSHNWREYVTWGGAAVILLVALLFLVRRLRAARPRISGGAA